MALKRLTQGALNTLSELYHDAVELVARATTDSGAMRDDLRNEWATAAHAGSNPEDLFKVLTTSAAPNYVAPENMNNLLGAIGQDLYRTPAGIARRAPGEEYLTVHSHPSGRPFPSSGDLLFNDWLPEPQRGYLGVVGTSTRESPDPNLLVGGATATLQRVPRGDPLIRQAHDYVRQWYPHSEGMLDDRYMQDWAAAQAPRRLEVLEQSRDLQNELDPTSRSETLDRMIRQAKRDTLHAITHRYGSAPPMMRLADSDVYDLYYTQPNLRGPAYLRDLDSDDLLDDLYTQLSRRGHLDYAEGGPV
jgi:hypothetical protein